MLSKIKIRYVPSGSMELSQGWETPAKGKIGEDYRQTLGGS
jgi:hypothetical protein